jgi:hypothetical protein
MAWYALRMAYHLFSNLRNDLNDYILEMEWRENRPEHSTGFPGRVRYTAIYLWTLSSESVLRFFGRF